MFSPNLTDLLKQFHKQTSIRRSLNLIDPMHDLDATLRSSEESAPETDPQLLGLASKVEGKETTRRRFM